MRKEQYVHYPTAASAVWISVVSVRVRSEGICESVGVETAGGERGESDDSLAFTEIAVLANAVTVPPRSTAAVIAREEEEEEVDDEDEDDE